MLTTPWQSLVWMSAAAPMAYGEHFTLMLHAPELSADVLFHSTDSTRPVKAKPMNQHMHASTVRLHMVSPVTVLRTVSIMH